MRLDTDLRIHLRSVCFRSKVIADGTEARADDLRSYTQRSVAEYGAGGRMYVHTRQAEINICPGIPFSILLHKQVFNNEMC